MPRLTSLGLRDNAVGTEGTLQIAPALAKAHAMECLIRTTIANDPFFSLKLQQVVAATRNIHVSRELVRVAIKKQGLSK